MKSHLEEATMRQIRLSTNKTEIAGHFLITTQRRAKPPVEFRHLCESKVFKQETCADVEW